MDENKKMEGTEANANETAPAVKDDKKAKFWAGAKKIAKKVAKGLLLGGVTVIAAIIGYLFGSSKNAESQESVSEPAYIPQKEPVTSEPPTSEAPIPTTNEG